MSHECEVIYSVCDVPVTCDICGRNQRSCQEWDGERGVHVACRQDDERDTPTRKAEGGQS